MLTYNELDGLEGRQVLENRYRQILDGVPYFQKHITLPRVRITLQVKLEIWADQPKPELILLNDRFDVVVETEPQPVEIITAESVDTAAPVPGGHPPDQIREMHGLPISQPQYGPREIGGHVYISDQEVPSSVEESAMPGLTVYRNSPGIIDGMATSRNATVMKIDTGPDGMRSHPGVSTREKWHLGSNKR